MSDTRSMNTSYHRSPPTDLTPLAIGELLRYRDVLAELLVMEERHVATMVAHREEPLRAPLAPTPPPSTDPALGNYGLSVADAYRKAVDGMTVFRRRHVDRLTTEIMSAKERLAAMRREAHSVAVALEPHGGPTAGPAPR